MEAKLQAAQSVADLERRHRESQLERDKALVEQQLAIKLEFMDDESIAGLGDDDLKSRCDKRKSQPADRDGVPASGHQEPAEHSSKRDERTSDADERTVSELQLCLENERREFLSKERAYANRLDQALKDVSVAEARIAKLESQYAEAEQHYLGREHSQQIAYAELTKRVQTLERQVDLLDGECKGWRNEASCARAELQSVQRALADAERQVQELEEIGQENGHTIEHLRAELKLLKQKTIR